MSILKHLPSVETEYTMVMDARKSRKDMGKLLRAYKLLVDVNVNKWKGVNDLNESWSDDLFQEGSIALMRAVDTYDISFNTRFTTWATICIEGAIRNTIKKNKNHIDTVSLNTLINDTDELETEGILASEITEPNLDESLSERSKALEFSPILSGRESDIMRIRYNLEI